MGSILKRSGSPYFYARFMVDGEEKWISTKKTKRREAQAIRAVFNHGIPNLTGH